MAVRRVSFLLLAAAASTCVATAVQTPADTMADLAIVEDGEVVEALASDDLCLAPAGPSGTTCALVALQHSGRPLKSGLVQASAGRPKHHGSDKPDLTDDWFHTLRESIRGIATNLTSIEWKLFYLGLDIASCNGTLLNGSGRVGGVNGTFVNWTNHSNTWIPTFDDEADPSE
eukprot:CAMPEP_0183444558 /NCGR_PEP_ID=MMETSP0370-20130417/95479_1 /TAXON_ID=268820 /ORGANISM="Peridinium aciculiferum, Strain PAER-2" /LENGTH=172 /DNA_ID=CAMNT_0025634965 /DNA_START=13 /DNA_END=528 /DNA_ORIENTATION=+